MVTKNDAMTLVLEYKNYILEHYSELINGAIDSIEENIIYNAKKGYGECFCSYYTNIKRCDIGKNDLSILIEYVKNEYISRGFKVKDEIFEVYNDYCYLEFIISWM